MNLKEQWRAIDGFPGYFVSDQGRILRKRLNRPEYIVKAHPDMHGYWVVNLCCGGKQIRRSVARTVAIAFIPNPSNKPTINHIKPDYKEDNSVSNLEWATHQEQRMHAFDMGAIPKTRKRLTVDQIHAARKLHNEGMAKIRIARELGLSDSVIGSLLAGKSYAYIQD